MGMFYSLVCHGNIQVSHLLKGKILVPFLLESIQVTSPGAKPNIVFLINTFQRRQKAFPDLKDCI